MPGREQRTVTLTDPLALRAVAHPARQALVKELFSGRILTATEAAELVGLSPSAVSHHLRALEKWGLAERAAAAGDARQRPWRGTGTSLSLDSGDDPAARAALEPIVRDLVRDVSELTEAYLATSESDPWRDGYRISRRELYLTEEEVGELSRRLDELCREYDVGRTSDDHPPDARRSSLAMFLVPAEPPPGPESVAER